MRGWLAGLVPADRQKQLVQSGRGGRSGSGSGVEQRQVYTAGDGGGGGGRQGQQQEAGSREFRLAGGRAGEMGWGGRV